MNFWNIIYNIALIGCVVCLVVALVLAVDAEIKARKLRRDIETTLKNKEDSDG